jgi:hypothetical protein
MEMGRAGAREVDPGDGGEDGGRRSPPVPEAEACRRSTFGERGKLMALRSRTGFPRALLLQHHKRAYLAAANRHDHWKERDSGRRRRGEEVVTTGGREERWGLSSWVLGKERETARGRRKQVEQGSDDEEIRYEVGPTHDTSVGVTPWTRGVPWRRRMERAGSPGGSKAFSNRDWRSSRPRTGSQYSRAPCQNLFATRFNIFANNVGLQV